MRYTTALCGQWVGDSEGERDTQKVPSDELVGFIAVSMFQIPASTDSLFQFPERCHFYIYAFLSFWKMGKPFSYIFHYIGWKKFVYSSECVWHTIKLLILVKIF